MSSTVLLAFIGTVAVLAITPGPSTMLGSAHGMRYGARGTMPTIAGDLSANTLQMLAASLGLAAIITNSATAFTVVKWAGVAYLVWMGLTYLRAAPSHGSSEHDIVRSPWARYAQGFVTSASNPKAIVFFAALFPQFVEPNAASVPVAVQLLFLGLVFLVIDGSAVLLYAATAGRLAAWLAAKGRARTQRRVTGVVLIGAAGLLALKGAPEPSS